MKVLIAVDGSEESRFALAEVQRLVPLAGAEVSLVHVVTPPMLGTDPVGYGLSSEPLIDDETRRGRALLKLLRCRLEEQGLRVRTMLRAGEPAGEILMAAKELAADLIVVGSHRYRPLERWLLGSVSEAVVRRFEGPVLVLRPVERPASRVDIERAPTSADQAPPRRPHPLG